MEGCRRLRVGWRRQHEKAGNLDNYLTYIHASCVGPDRMLPKVAPTNVIGHLQNQDNRASG
jgi:hypothetical protein